MANLTDGTLIWLVITLHPVVIGIFTLPMIFVKTWDL